MKSVLIRLARWLGVAAPRPGFAEQLDRAIQREEGVLLRVAALERSIGAHRVAARRCSASNPHEE